MALILATVTALSASGRARDAASEQTIL